MYLNFFSLNKEPFQITPDPSFLFLSQGHKEALASIIYGVEKFKGFILIIGAVGVGKTTILRAYLEKADKNKLRIIYLFNSNLSYGNLLAYIFRELNIIPESNEICDMVDQLHQALITEYKQGRIVLLIIDEAQNTPVDTLENLRMLSNLETASEKLIQIVFSAQPEFEKTLNLEELKQLKQRIAVKAVISPLTLEEGLTYIQHRLKRATDTTTVIFTNSALKEIVRKASGIPRLINVLCDNSLITAFGYGKKKIGMSIVKEIIRDFGIQKPFYLKWHIYLVVGILLTVGLFFSIKAMAPVLALKPELPRQAAILPTHPPTQINNGKSEDDQAGEKILVNRIVRKGDTLARLIKEVYGYVDSRMIKMVKDANPSILNENLIHEGRSIVFPSND